MEGIIFLYVLLILSCLGVLIFFLIFRKNKKMDKENFNIYFSYEESNKTFIKDVDKEYIILNVDKFKGIIGNGKSFYLQAFLNKKNQFNGGAFLGGLFWLGYRGLILEYFIFLGIFILIDILVLYFNITLPQYFFGMIISTTLGILGNYLYFLKIKNKIENKKRRLNPFLGVLIVIISYIIYIFLIDYIYTCY